MVATVERSLAVESPNSKLEFITTEIAAEYLKHNPRNRRIEKTQVQRYAAIIEAEQWKITGQGIQFDNRGDLIDGQHRLSAIVQTGIGVWMFVTRGLDPIVRDVVDTGKRRTIGDVLTMRGVTDAAAVGGALQWKWRYDNHRMIASSIRIEHPELEQVLDDNPGIAIGGVTRGSLVPHNLLPLSLAVWLRYETGRADEARALAFFDAFGTGSNIAKGDVCFTLRRLLLSDLNSRQKLTRQRQIMLATYVTRAWNLFVEGGTAATFVIRPNAPFPVIWGAAPAHPATKQQRSE